MNNNIGREIVIFKDGDLVLEVNIVPDAETVWSSYKEYHPRRRIKIYVNYRGIPGSSKRRGTHDK